MKRRKRIVVRPAVIQPQDQTIKLIPLTQGYVTSVSAHRYAEHSAHHWHAIKGSNTDRVYAVRNSLINENEKRHLIFLHREILGLAHGTGRERMGDHIKPAETLNNTDENLRFANATEQCQNQRPRAQQGTSRFKGVYWHAANKKWGVQITINKCRIFLGLFDIEEDAARAHDEAAKKHFGEFAQLNFH